jgi:hypothetical protein
MGHTSTTPLTIEPCENQKSRPLSEVLLLFCCWEQPYENQMFWAPIRSSDVFCCWEQPCENQKFWTPIRSSDVVLLLGATLRKSEVLVSYQNF